MPRTLADWLAFIERQHPKSIAMGLERVRAVAARLGLERPAARVVTVAGTNGKGSTVAFIESIARAQGLRVAAYTSPHLLRFNERIRIDGREVEDAALVAGFAAVEAARGDVPLTYFEYATLCALWLFQRAGLDLAVLEVGLGGRLDAVNLVDADAAVITTVDLDHQDWLGHDTEAIGFEKAGIYRPGRPAFCADPLPPQSLLGHAAAISADLRLVGRDFGFERDTENRLQWRWWCRSGNRVVKRSLAYPGLRGPTQLFNAAVALAALDSIADRLPVTMQAIRPGLIETELPGRFQVVPGKPAIVLDVGHNPQALKVLADNLGSMGFFDNTHAVVGMLADKDIAGALHPLKGKVDHWYAASLGGPRGTSAAALADIIAAGGLGGEVSCHDSPAAAMQAAKGRAGESDRILAFGSFYTVAGALQVVRANR